MKGPPAAFLIQRLYGVMLLIGVGEKLMLIVLSQGIDHIGRRFAKAVREHINQLLKAIKSTHNRGSGAPTMGRRGILAELTAAASRRWFSLGRLKKLHVIARAMC